jgi:hypothetical protein
VRRRRRNGEQEQDTPWSGEDDPGTAVTGGPWDVHGDVPEGERIDFGSLRVPAREGFEVQVSMAEDQPAWVTVVHGESGLQLQAFAAPKTGGLWADVREEIAAEVAKAGGECAEADGPFGVEVRAQIVQADPRGQVSRHPVRFLGVDGPRWFLRGVISGPAAARDEAARSLEEVFADVVVVRGEHPVPPRDLLEIRLPEEALQALAEEAEPEGNPWGGADPFDRGPEITETR